MKKNLGGRPKLPRGQDKGAVIALRVLKSERKQFEAVAKRNGMKLSEWMRRVLLNATLEDKKQVGPKSEDVGIEPPEVQSGPRGVEPL